MEALLGNKREREVNNEDDAEKENQKKEKLEDDIKPLKTMLKVYKTILQLKEEAIKEYNNLTETQKNDNLFLLKVNEKFDILEEVNYNILINDINKISINIKVNNKVNKEYPNNDVNNNNSNVILINDFIQDYKKYRYTISTNKRIELLKNYLCKYQDIKDIKIDNESKDPKDILKEVLLNLNELYSRIKNLKPSKFTEEFKKNLDIYDFDLKEKFFAPANFGNMNYKFSLLFSDYLKNFKNLTYKNDGEIDTNNSNIKRRFEKSMEVIHLFIGTIKNEGNILNNELYYKYLKIINFIFDIYRDKRRNNFLILMISSINNCMINLIKKEDLKRYNKKNPKVLYIKRNETYIELNDEIIDTLLMDEILIYKNNDCNLEFDIKKYNVNVLSDLQNNLSNKSWINSNFEFIEEYNFINCSNELKREFKNYIKEIIQSPYIKEVYKKTETRFNKDDAYLLDSNEIYGEIFNFIQFFPFPFDDVYGYCDKASLDIYITMYDNSYDTFELLGKLYANANDSCHEIFHVSIVYYIMNSENKNFADFYSKVPLKKKTEYIETQKNFLNQINSEESKIKKKDIDLGDAIEIECYGFCIREFYLLSVLNLFIKDTWYKEENYKKFKEHYINWCKLNDDEKNNNNTKEKGKDNYKEEEKDKSNEIININSYLNANKILKIFFELFKLENNEIESKNIILFKRKREFIGDNGNIIFKRELCTTPHTNPRKEF